MYRTTCKPHTKVRMIPECPCLIGHGKIIEEGFVGSNGTLRNKGRSIYPIEPVLKEPVSVLKTYSSDTEPVDWLTETRC